MSAVVPTADVSTHRASSDARAIVSRAVAATRRRPRLIALILAIATFLFFCIEIATGQFSIPLADVIPAIFGSGDEMAVTVANTIRLPRALTAVLVGVSFGLSGAVFQSVARNPLASPDILGITLGSSAIAVLVITTIGGSFTYIFGGAFAGAVLIAGLIYLLAYRQGVSPYRFVLVGIGLGAVAGALIGLLLVRSSVLLAAQATVWLTGSLNSVGWETVGPTSVVVLALAPLTFVLASRMRTLQLGDDTSQGLGLSVERARLGLLAVAVGLAGVGVAAAGPVPFVAFMAGPIARRLTKSPVTLVSSALTGALIMLVADILGRALFAPSEIPVGIVTAVIGAPFLLWLLARANRIGREG